MSNVAGKMEKCGQAQWFFWFLFDFNPDSTPAFH
jgi:hypothetical protein